MICPRCGEQCREPFLRVVDGEIICLDCAEKA
jgi:formylmethanofuran dehydrogenase subunit E